MYRKAWKCFHSRNIKHFSKIKLGSAYSSKHTGDTPSAVMHQRRALPGTENLPKAYIYSCNKPNSEYWIALYDMLT
jgi:hypothetical protein